jgi:hypothetical protein
MQQAGEIVKALGGMPGTTLIVVVILASFALAAFAIYAVMTVSKGKHNGD